MLGILVQLVISWLIIWLVERKHLTVLGLRPSSYRMRLFFLLFLVTAFFCASGFVMKMVVGGQEWHLNPKLTASLAYDAIIWNIKSVLFEELIFRGVLLYILIRRLGARPAVLISAVGFGIYHWFSFGIFGQVVPMIFILIITGAMGLLLAYAYTKTLSIYIPIAIHLGWNLTQQFIFSDGPIGHGIFVPADGKSFLTTSYVLFFLVSLLPMIGALLTNYLILKRIKPVAHLQRLSQNDFQKLAGGK